MRYLIPIIAALALTGCAAMDAVVSTTTGAAAIVVDRACAGGMTVLAIEGRRALVAEINEKTTIGNHTPTDCDSDGQPDFAIDATGVPLPAVP